MPILSCLPPTLVCDSWSWLFRCRLGLHSHLCHHHHHHQRRGIGKKDDNPNAWIGCRWQWDIFQLYKTRNISSDIEYCTMCIDNREKINVCIKKVALNFKLWQNLYNTQDYSNKFTNETKFITNLYWNYGCFVVCTQSQMERKFLTVNITE